MAQLLKKGDRVTVEIPPRSPFTGLITGEGRTGLWWMVRKDGAKWPQAIHKDFCHLESYYVSTTNREA